MDEIILFTDGSVHSQSHVGYGAYLVMHKYERSLDSFIPDVKIRRFENTSSTKLELQTLLWALEQVNAAGKKIWIYTDAQTIVGLPARRSRLEQNDYCNQRGKRLPNHELYREIFRKTDQVDWEFIKVKGHLSLCRKDDLDRFFTLVDRASRKALREHG